MILTGHGNIVPPLRDHVIIYFLEKGATEKSAHEFWYQWNQRHWKGRGGILIANWKVCAWRWIYYSHTTNLLS